MPIKNKIIFFSFIFSILIHLALILFVSIKLKNKKILFLKENNTYIKIVDLTKIETNTNNNKNKNKNLNKKNSKESKQTQNIYQKNILNQSMIEEKNNNYNTEKKLEEEIYIPNFKIDKYPEYPLKAKRLGFEGEIILKIKVDKEGKILEIAIEKSTGYEILDNAAIEAVKSWDFKRVILTKEKEMFVFKTKIIFKLDN